MSPASAQPGTVSADRGQRCTHVHPNVPVTLLARIMPGKDPLHLQLVLARQRRNLHALPAAPVKLPPVIAALQVLPVKPPIGKRNPPVRTSIPHRKRLALDRSAPAPAAPPAASPSPAPARGSRHSAPPDTKNPTKIPHPRRVPAFVAPAIRQPGSLRMAILRSLSGGSALGRGFLRVNGAFRRQKYSFMPATTGAASKLHGFILQQSQQELICRKPDLAIFLKTAAMRFSTFH